MESNKVIEEFMGWKLETIDYNDGSGSFFYIFNRYEKDEVVETYSGGDSWYLSESSTIPFNRSWDWLIPCIKKISDELGYDWYMDNIVNYLLDNNIQRAFEISVDAIRTHNEGA